MDTITRFYDPYLNRWIQPDTIVPEKIQGVLAWDRYSYANNNPIRYNDPSGHCIGPLLVVCITAATFIADNVGVITAVATVGAVTSFVTADAPRQELINDPIASQSEFENAVFQAGVWLTAGTAALDFGHYYSTPLSLEKSSNKPGDNRLLLPAGQNTNNGNYSTITPGKTVDPRTGVEVGRFISNPNGDLMIEPVGGNTTGSPNGQFIQTRNPDGSFYQRYDGEVGNPHGHGFNSRGGSIDIWGNPVNRKSPEAHWKGW